MSDTLYNLIFLLFAALTIGSAILVVSLNNLLHAAVSLFFCLSGVAALFVLLGADFLGVIQLLAYAGGILVLIIFGVFLTARIQEGTEFEVSEKKMPIAIGSAIAFAIFIVITLIVSKVDWPETTRTFESTTKPLGDLLLSKYLLPFELVSILLLFAMVGAAIIVRKEIGDEK